MPRSPANRTAPILLFASILSGCEESADPPSLDAPPAAQLPQLLDPDNPDLSQCGDALVDSATTKDDGLGRISGWEATNTDTACPRSPAACGAWWAAIVPVGGEVDAEEGELFTLTFATDPVDDGLCETHVAQTVVGRLDVMETQDIENGRIDPVLLCLIDEHGHVASGLAEVFTERGRITPAREPCD